MKNLFTTITLALALLFGSAAAMAVSYGNIDLRFTSDAGTRHWYPAFKYGASGCYNLAPPGRAYLVYVYAWFRTAYHEKINGVPQPFCNYTDSAVLFSGSTLSSSTSTHIIETLTKRNGEVTHESGGANGENVDAYFMCYIIHIQNADDWSIDYSEWLPVPNNGYPYVVTPFEFTVNAAGGSPSVNWPASLSEWGLNNWYYAFPSTSAPNLVPLYGPNITDEEYWIDTGWNSANSYIPPL